MPRPASKGEPLRGSIMQNRTALRRGRFAGISAFLKGLFKTNAGGFFLRLCVVLVVLASVIYGAVWLVSTGWPQQQTEKLATASLQLTKAAHFSVRDIVVTGRRYTDKKELMDALQTGAGEPILAFDPADAAKRVQALPWIKAVSVERLLPDVVKVDLQERTPMARWELENQKMVIDTEGKVLASADVSDFKDLPLVVGKGAPENAADFLAVVRGYALVSAAAHSAVFVGERRWNLFLTPKIMVKLPEENLSAALEKLENLIKNQKLLERDIVGVDLRIFGRTILETSLSAKDKNKELAK